MADMPDDHRAVCFECWEPWPCAHHREEVEVFYFRFEMENCCHHCGKGFGGHKGTSRTGHTTFGGVNLDTGEPGGVKFHSARSRFPKCVEAAAAYGTRWEQSQLALRRALGPVRDG